MIRRRRNFIRPFVARPLKPVLLDHGPRQMLRNAHAMMESANYDQAAILFSKLGEAAIARGMNVRAPFLFLQAGRAYFLIKDYESGKNFILRGLGLFAENEDWHLLCRFCDRSIHELESLDQKILAQEIRDWQYSVLPEGFSPTHAPGQNQKKTNFVLPPKCPYCGATVSPIEVEWLDEKFASCIYCGSVIQG